MSAKQVGVSVLVAAFLVLLTGCAHQLTVLNLDDYHASGRVEVPRTSTIGVLEGDIDPSATVLFDGVAAGIARSGAQVLNPYRPGSDKPADLIARIGIKAKYDGSGTNFWLNFPGFLIWAPAWNGYVYKADLAVHVELFKGADTKTAVDTFDIPVNLDIRHAEMDRTWMEVSWFEVGIIALVTGFIYTKYDTDVTPLLMREIERPIGDYIAHKILAKFPSP
jgi:hypothetical protein